MDSAYRRQQVALPRAMAPELEAELSTPEKGSPAVKRAGNSRAAGGHRGKAQACAEGPRAKRPRPSRCRASGKPSSLPADHRESLGEHAQAMDVSNDMEDCSLIA